MKKENWETKMRRREVSKIPFSDERDRALEWREVRDQPNLLAFKVRKEKI